MLFQHYPKIALPQVKKELYCVNDLSQELTKLCAKGETDKAKKLLHEVSKSINQLDIYAKAKKIEPKVKQHYREMSDYQAWVTWNER